VVVVGGGSDVKMGCTIYWKNFPLKRARGVYISIVNCQICEWHNSTNDNDNDNTSINIEMY